MKKKFLVLILLFLLVGCTKKDSITVDKFQSIMEENKFTVIDITKEVNNTNLDNFIVATNDSYQIEFSVFKSDDLAISSYNSYIELEKNEDYKPIEEKNDNYYKYSLKTNDSYIVISRIDNTTIYSNVNIDYENDLNKILEKLGY